MKIKRKDRKRGGKMRKEEARKEIRRSIGVRKEKMQKKPEDEEIEETRTRRRQSAKNVTHKAIKRKKAGRP